MYLAFTIRRLSVLQRQQPRELSSDRVAARAHHCVSNTMQSVGRAAAPDRSKRIAVTLEIVCGTEQTHPRTARIHDLRDREDRIGKRPSGNDLMHDSTPDRRASKPPL